MTQRVNLNKFIAQVVVEIAGSALMVMSLLVVDWLRRKLGA